MSTECHHKSDADMHVVFLDHESQFSGAEIALYRTCIALKAQERVRLTAILASEGDLNGALREAGVEVIFLPIPDGSRTLRRHQVKLRLSSVRPLLAYLKYVWLLRDRLRKLNPQVVHSFSLKANVYGSFAALLARVPHIWQANDQLTDDYLPASVSALSRFVATHISTSVIANSSSTLRTVGGKGVVIYPPLPSEWSTPFDSREHAGERQVVGVVGRLAPWKGQDLFIKAFARAFADNVDVRGVVIGGALFGEESWERHLRDLVHEYDLEKRIEFLGHVDDVEDHLKSMAALIHCSSIPEPFGQVVSEALFMGCPVIAANAGGPGEFLIDEHSALLYPIGDVDELAKRMKRINLDDSLRLRLSLNGREAVASMSPALISEQLMQVYRHLVLSRYRAKVSFVRLGSGIQRRKSS